MIFRPTIELGCAALLLMSSIGCADDGDEGNSDDTDGADAGDPGDDPGDLVGTWRYADEFGHAESWELDVDRSFRYDRTSQDGSSFAVEGSYTVDGDTLRFDGEYVDSPGRSLISEMTFYAGPDQASIPAYVPTGDHDGWVGTWTMRYLNRIEYDDGRPDSVSGGEETVELRADGSARWELTFVEEDEAQVIVGTWRELEGAIELVEVVDGAEFPWSFPTLDDAALAQFPLDRVE